MQALVLAHGPADAGLEERGVGCGHGAVVDRLGDGGELVACFGGWVESD